MLLNKTLWQWKSLARYQETYRLMSRLWMPHHSANSVTLIQPFFKNFLRIFFIIISYRIMKKYLSRLASVWVRFMLMYS